MKIGILGTAYNCVEGLLERLKPFQRPDFIISIVSSQFKEYADLGYPYENEDTVQFLSDLQETGGIWALTTTFFPRTEIEARNHALESLLKQNCDYIWLVDFLDENYTDKEINNILKFIAQRSEAWYSIHFKNYVFDDSHYIDGFCPPRIFKSTYFNGRNIRIMDFCEDNGLNYQDRDERITNFRELSNTKIPQYLAQVSHYTWLSNSNSKRKIEYQERRWGKNACSYRWDEKLGLQFNEEYFRANNLALPEVLND